MNNERLFNRNFVLIVIGQLVSIFANAILRFALPLYILDQTGSTKTFGIVLAIAAIPPILFSPLGGILADRCNRKNLMVILDFITAVVITGFSFLLLDETIVIIIAVLMVLFSIIQSLYQPVVKASIPVVSSQENLEQANGIVSLVDAFSNVLGPLVAGVLYGNFGIWPIMFTGVICFFVAAIMEMFIIMSFERKKESGSISEIIKSDLKTSFVYITQDNPIMLKAIMITSGMNLFMTSMMLVGLPVMIKIKLGLSSQLYGFTEGAMALGMIVGGIVISLLGKKIKVAEAYKMLLTAAWGLIPIALAFSISLAPMVVYWIISCSCFMMAVAITIFTIMMMSFVQRETPDHLMGKVISYILVMSQCTLPVGQAIYGFLFEAMLNSINIIIFITAICSVIIAVYSKKTFYGLSNKKTVVV